MGKTTASYSRIKKFLTILGPGLITGASDDDPSGIATYSQAGAQYGFSTLWTALITFPLMAAIQEMCARIGLITTVGLTTTLKKHYPKSILYIMVGFSIPAIILNIGSDIEAMGAVGNMMFPQVSQLVFSVLFTLILLLLIIFLPYNKIVRVLKYLCLSVFLYLIVPFFTKPDWWLVLKSTFIPQVKANKEFISMLVAILGTTISPYLFFWQATMEAQDAKNAKRLIMVDKKLVLQNGDSPQKAEARERRFLGGLIDKMKLDVNIGMLLSNVVMFFIILTTGSALFSHGIKNIETVNQAAQALEPVAGKAAYGLFAIGVIGTGFLAIPVLSGSLSYIISETFGWSGTLDKKFYQAKAFYTVIIISVVIGLLLNYIGISPIKALIYTAILYGITAPVLIAIVLHIGNNQKIMGTFTNGKLSNTLGWITLLLMTVSAGYLIYLQFT